MNMYYKLDGHEVVPLKNVHEWAKYFEHANRHVDKTNIGDVHVSTLFLGLNHEWDETKPPLLFESMVFGGSLDGEQTHCSTWQQAVDMHATMCHMVRKSQGLL